MRQLCLVNEVKGRPPARCQNTRLANPDPGWPDPDPTRFQADRIRIQPGSRLTRSGSNPVSGWPDPDPTCKRIKNLLLTSIWCLEDNQVRIWFFGKLGTGSESIQNTRILTHIRCRLLNNINFSKKNGGQLRE